jgi:hypothetical protein
MQRIAALLMALGLVVVFSGVTLAGDGCGYKTQATQAGMDKADSTQQPAVAAAEKADSDKTIVARTDKTAKSVLEIKK